MKRENVLKRLQSLKGRLGEVGVTQVGLFGSTVRGENTSRSDIDILLDFGTGHETYANFLAACHILEDTFKRNKVDVITYKGLSPHIGKTIMEEVVYV